MEYPRLREIREDSDLTQKEIAARLKVAQRTYSGYENGTRSIPIPLLIELARLYGVSVDYLLGLTNQKEPYPEG